MTNTLETGLTTTTRIEVDQQRTISFMGDEGRVYATPELVRDIESCCRGLLLKHVGDDRDSVGTRIELSHLAPTPLGMWVDLTVTIKDIDGRAVTFDVTARDPLDEICDARHSRFIVDVAKTLDRIKGKRKAADAA